LRKRLLSHCCLESRLLKLAHPSRKLSGSSLERRLDAICIEVLWRLLLYLLHHLLLLLERDLTSPCLQLRKLYVRHIWMCRMVSPTRLLVRNLRLGERRLRSAAGIGLHLAQ